MWVSAAHGVSRVMNTEMLNCTFTDCAMQAIYGESLGYTAFNHAQSATLNTLIKNCLFANVNNGCVMKGSGGKNGSYIGYGYANPKIVGNIFQDLPGTAFLMLTGSYTGSSQPPFQNNTVINCNAGVDATDPWDAQVQNNIFVGATTAVKVAGVLSRLVSYNNFYNNTANFSGYPATYGDVVFANRNGTPCDILYNIYSNPQFRDPCSLLLATNSPCVDAGMPSVHDICFSVSQGTTWSDLGAFGGPDACNWPTPVSCLPPTVVVPAIPPSCLGQTVTMTATAGAGAEPMSYQWWFNGTLLSGQTGTSLVLSNLQKTATGLYCVVVTNVSGGTTSAPVHLVVNDACIDLRMYAGLTVAGQQGGTYVLSYTTDLGNPNSWLPLATNTVSASGWFYLDMESPFSPRRFYRADLRP